MRSSAGLNPVRSVTRAVSILKAFIPNGPYMTLTQIATACDLDKGTTRRLLLTLMAEEFVTYDPATQKYSLGMSVLRVASAVPDHGNIRDVAGPVLQDLSRETGTTTLLSMYFDGEAVCLDRFHDDMTLEVKWWRLGGSMPINCGAASRIMLAYISDDEAARALIPDPMKLTPHSVTNRDALLAERPVVREHEWAIAIDDVVEGLSAIACPILDHEANLVAVISLAGLTPHIVEAGKPRFLTQLNAARARIEKANSRG